MAPDSNFTRPKYQPQIAQCKSQKVRSPNGTISFSVLGIVIILIVGTLLVLTDLLLDVIMGFMRRKLHWKDHKRFQWILDEKLQLQRLAFEESGQGQWSRGTDAVPVTRDSDVLGLPHDIDMTHPRLGRQWRQNSANRNGIPESEGLMGAKSICYTAEQVPLEYDH